MAKKRRKTDDATLHTQDENLQKWIYACDQLARDWTPEDIQIHADVLAVCFVFDHHSSIAIACRHMNGSPEFRRRKSLGDAKP